ncbi:MAG: hypothetical protein PHX80_04355 [Candidatus Nanoarchaeia archaeon]|nr:hypothetical protein [Candidatus Nanoarchaeia archaeon]
MIKLSPPPDPPIYSDWQIMTYQRKRALQDKPISTAIDKYNDIDIKPKQVIKKPALVYQQSKYKGVLWIPKRYKWRAVYKKKHLGFFIDEEDAHIAYCDAAGIDISEGIR